LKKAKKVPKKKPEYREGPEAREKFERVMKTLFQVPKSKLKKRGKD
jgi:hypothetical protein